MCCVIRIYPWSNQILTPPSSWCDPCTSCSVYLLNPGDAIYWTLGSLFTEPWGVYLLNPGIIPMTHSHFKRVESGLDPDPQWHTNQLDPDPIQFGLRVQSWSGAGLNPFRIRIEFACPSVSAPTRWILFGDISRQDFRSMRMSDPFITAVK